MMSLRLCAFAVICATGLAANTAAAADLAGDWTLNIPNDPSTWTFMQATPSTPQFTASTTIVQGPVSYRYDFNPGVTVGPLVVALETLSIQGQTPFPVGVLLATSDSSTLSGTLIALDLSTTAVTGQKVVARTKKSRGR